MDGPPTVSEIHLALKYGPTLHGYVDGGGCKKACNVAHYTHRQDISTRHAASTVKLLETVDDFTMTDHLTEYLDFQAHEHKQPETTGVWLCMNDSPAVVPVDGHFFIPTGTRNPPPLAGGADNNRELSKRPTSLYPA